MTALAGNDTVFGGAGNNSIQWNDPTGDTVFGGAGNDTIIGSDTASDFIAGGSGNDYIQGVHHDCGRCHRGRYVDWRGR